MMFIQREKINYLCEKYNLKVCQLGDTFKLFIQSSIFPKNNYWYLFSQENAVGWDWILEFDGKSFQNEHQYIKITNSQSMVMIDEKKSAFYNTPKYQLW